MMGLQQLLWLLGYKNLGNHLLRHIRVARDLSRRGPCFVSTQQVLPLIPDQHDRYQYECACAHLATGREKPAK
jgi:hypothetical protein